MLSIFIVNRKIHYNDYEGEKTPLITPKKAKKLKTTEGERVSLRGQRPLITPKKQTAYGVILKAN